MQSFAICPWRSKALIFPDRYKERKPKPAKAPAQSENPGQHVLPINSAMQES